MDTNQLPRYDMSENTTGCCPRFINKDEWDNQSLHFENKPFVKAKGWSLFYIPLNIGSVFGRVLGKIQKDGSFDENNYVILSSDPSPFWSEHLFASEKQIEGEETVEVSGDFITKVYEGNYSDMGKWYKDMDEVAKAQGKQIVRQHFFYPTCPKCAKAYGENYVVGFAQVS